MQLNRPHTNCYINFSLAKGNKFFQIGNLPQSRYPQNQQPLQVSQTAGMA